MELLLEIARALGSVFLVVLVGAAVRRVGWLNDELERGLVGLLIRVLMPALVLSALLGHPPAAAELWVGPAWGAGATLLGFALAAVLTRLPAAWTGLIDSAERRTFVLGTGLGNYAYLAIPVATALHGPEVVPTLLLYNLGVELVLWTVGLQILPSHGPRAGLSRVLNAPFVALVVGVVVGASGLGPYVPTPILEALAKLGQAAVPLGLLTVGGALASELGQVRLRPVLAASAVRFALLPIAAWVAVRLTGLAGPLAAVVLVQAAMPGAVAPVMLARLYGGSPALASRITLGTSLLGLAAVPVVLAVLRLLEGRG